MKILTEINIDCSFMQTIIKLPQKRVDLISVGIDKNVVDRLESYLDFAKDIQTLFQSTTHLKNFVEYCVKNNQVYYVKTFLEDKEDLSENREFICFDEYHRNKKKNTICFLELTKIGTGLTFHLLKIFKT